MRSTTLIGLVFLSLFLATVLGCKDEPRLDATDAASKKASIARMTAGMDAAEKSKFGEDLMTIGLAPAVAAESPAASPIVLFVALVQSPSPSDVVYSATITLR
jgi:hypothetical protein